MGKVSKAKCKAVRKKAHKQALTRAHVRLLKAKKNLVQAMNDIYEAADQLPEYDLTHAEEIVDLGIVIEEKVLPSLDSELSRT